jgi:hypothetical protein
MNQILKEKVITIVTHVRMVGNDVGGKNKKFLSFISKKREIEFII